MALRDSALILAWILLVLLLLAFAGCARALHLLHAKLSEASIAPRRMRPGDSLVLPAELRQRLGNQDRVILVLGRQECRSCLAAANHLLAVATNANVPLLLLWSGESPEALAHTSVANQAETFELLSVRFLPYAIDLQAGKVNSCGGVGDPKSLRDFASSSVDGVIEAVPS